ncbi:MAG: bifunctional phosphoribosylaminoimidazolecarboxamide formyltransferase/IMP cyclohydrolase [Burkholderiales bacterium]|nr:bifunctional phosphoribosylaminoimidazolecarboxamide formyltransferase/IMP cyclohydrolase [Burkholderiales bacterium]
MIKIQRALISVSEKAGVVDFARLLANLNVEILSTGGTAKLLAENAIAVREVADYTGFPEMLDGRVKTLHPKVHGGILGRRDLPEHVVAMKQHGIAPIDMVVVNLYPFQQTVSNPDCLLDDAIENIDIGGPAMVRAAAKNYRHVAIVTDPGDYRLLAEELSHQQGTLSAERCFTLAKKAFSHTARYDGAISNYLTAVAADGGRIAYSENLNLQLVKRQDLRYGENPHQTAAFYTEQPVPAGTLANYQQLQGKELSYNNIADADAAWECVKVFDAPACVIVKHSNPCGVAIGDHLANAYQRAFSGDTTAAFGGIIAFNRLVDGETARSVMGQFVEVIVAPGFSEEAQTALQSKANVRLLAVPLTQGGNSFDYKRVGGGLLVQSADAKNIAIADLKVVTKVKPNAVQLDNLLFAFRVAKFVKSNAIVFCSSGRTLGIGAGQMSRVDSTRIASLKAQAAGFDLKGSVAASDAFFPFRDGVDVIAEAGATAVIQPGGSMRDEEVIAAADEHAIAMVLTGVRHFRH